jgi:MoaA/NifB/PqqE/SkfB family radical SAM enzyme
MIGDRSCEEMDTGEIVPLIDELHRGGMRRLGLTGGEALLRDDLPEIIRHARQKGIYVTVNSNGLLVIDRRDRLRDANALVLSLNGERETHEATKDGTSHSAVLAAIEWAVREGKDVVTITTLTGGNLSAIPDLLRTARRMSFWATFQPVLLCGSLHSFPADIDFDRKAMAQAAVQLAAAKRTGWPVANTHLYLRYWRDFYSAEIAPRPSRCGVSDHFCTISPDGTITPCNLAPHNLPYRNGREAGFLRAFQDMPAANCSSFCAGPYFELDRLFRLNPEAWLNGAHIVAGRQRATRAAR